MGLIKIKEILSMPRGVYNSVTDIRRRIFTAIAEMAYSDDTDYARRIEEIPYEILHPLY